MFCSISRWTNEVSMRSQNVFQIAVEFTTPSLIAQLAEHFSNIDINPTSPLNLNIPSGFLVCCQGLISTFVCYQSLCSVFSSSLNRLYCSVIGPLEA